MKTDMNGSRYKKAETQGQFSNLLVYHPDVNIKSQFITHLYIKNIPRILYYKKNLTHKVYCVKNRTIINVLFQFCFLL